MFRNIAFWLIIGLALIVVFNMLTPSQTAKKELPYSEFIDAAIEGNVKSVTIKEKKITGDLVD